MIEEDRRSEKIFEEPFQHVPGLDDHIERTKLREVVGHPKLVIIRVTLLPQDGSDPRIEYGGYIIGRRDDGGDIADRCLYRSPESPHLPEDSDDEKLAIQDAKWRIKDALNTAPYEHLEEEVLKFPYSC